VLVWNALQGAPSLVVPPELYFRIVHAFAKAGNVGAMEEAVTRMKRPRDGAQKPPLQMLLVMFDAYIAAGQVEKAREVLTCVPLSSLAVSVQKEEQRARDISSAISFSLLASFYHTSSPALSHNPLTFFSPLALSLSLLQYVLCNCWRQRGRDRQ
jgi:hypothetical protein